jgi:hypothetical protein
MSEDEEEQEEEQEEEDEGESTGSDEQPDNFVRRTSRPVKFVHMPRVHLQ